MKSSSIVVLALAAVVSACATDPQRELDSNLQAADVHPTRQLVEAALAKADRFRGWVAAPPVRGEYPSSRVVGLVATPPPA